MFAGSDEGAVNWAIIASLIETAKLNDVNPHAWLTDKLTKLVYRWPVSRIDELMPLGLREDWRLNRQGADGTALTFEPGARMLTSPRSAQALACWGLPRLDDLKDASEQHTQLYM